MGTNTKRHKPKYRIKKFYRVLDSAYPAAAWMKAGAHIPAAVLDAAHREPQVIFHEGSAYVVVEIQVEPIHPPTRYKPGKLPATAHRRIAADLKNYSGLRIVHSMSSETNPPPGYFSEAVELRRTRLSHAYSKLPQPPCR
jgi:hypothetical protein